MDSIVNYLESTVYVVCAGTALVCTLLLLRSYRQTGFRLLLWTSICFLMFTINNIVLFIDVVLVPDMDLAWFQSLSALLGGIVLLYGLIWETETR